MQSHFKVGERARRIGAVEVGKVVDPNLNGLVKVEYEHPGRVSVGLYAPEQIEHVKDVATNVVALPTDSGRDTDKKKEKQSS